MDKRARLESEGEAPVTAAGVDAMDREALLRLEWQVDEDEVAIEPDAKERLAARLAALRAELNGRHAADMERRTALWVKVDAITEHLPDDVDTLDVDGADLSPEEKALARELCVHGSLMRAGNAQVYSVPRVENCARCLGTGSLSPLESCDRCTDLATGPDEPKFRGFE